jgi:dTDP-4-dehydrorhamnose 3,5-epimerase
MQIKIAEMHFDAVKVLIPEVYEDERGFFLEQYRADIFRELGMKEQFVQENHSGSIKGVIRGLHFQWDPPMGKLMRVINGAAFLVAVDIRKGSPTIGKWFGIECSRENRKQLWAPAGFARGFCVLSDYVEIQYLCTGIYNSNGESGIRWNDPEIGIKWPIENPVLSDKDKNAQFLSQWLESKNSDYFKYEG